MYLNAVYYYLLLLAIILAGFWRSFFAKLGSPDLALVHYFHGAGMLAWIVLLIAQCWLIKTKRRKAHRFLGWTSVVLAPTAIVGGYFVVAHIVSSLPTPAPAWAAQAAWFGFFQLAFFAVLYLLGLRNRKQPLIHMRYMLASGLMFLNPGLSRLINWLNEVSSVQILTGFSPMLIPLAIGIMMILDDRKRGGFKPPWIIFSAGWLVNYLVSIYLRDFNPSNLFVDLFRY